MTKYIDKRQVLEKLDEFVKLNEDCGFEYSALSLAMVSNMIDHIPATDVAPAVRGKWNGWHGDKMVDEETQRKYRYYECSECRRRSAVKSRFCPNCGAKMDGGDKT